MKVRMKTLMSGPGGSYQPGQIADLPAAEAKELIRGRYAEAVNEPAPAVVHEAQTAAPAEAKAEAPAAPEAAVDAEAEDAETAEAPRFFGLLPGKKKPRR